MWSPSSVCAIKIAGTRNQPKTPVVYYQFWIVNNKTAGKRPVFFGSWISRMTEVKLSIMLWKLNSFKSNFVVLNSWHLHKFLHSKGEFFNFHSKTIWPLISILRQFDVLCRSISLKLWTTFVLECWKFVMFSFPKFQLKKE